MQLLQFLAGKEKQPACAAGNASPEQCFVGINVAYSAEQLLIQQRTLNREFCGREKARAKSAKGICSGSGAGSFEFLDYAQASEAAKESNEP